MTEFKQIIGRGTRVRDDYGKLWFNIIDYTGSPTQNFADPSFDGEPTLATQEEIDEFGARRTTKVIAEEPAPSPADEETQQTSPVVIEPPQAGQPRKYYFDNGKVEFIADLVHELDADGRVLRVVRLTDYTSEQVRRLCADETVLRSQWSNSEQRSEIIVKLKERGIDFNELAEQAKRADADPFDLLCNLAFSIAILTRRRRADRVKRDWSQYLQKYAPEARTVLNEILEKYAEHGAEQFILPDVLYIPPISNRGTVGEIIQLFGGPESLREAVKELQEYRYAA